MKNRIPIAALAAIAALGILCSTALASAPRAGEGAVKEFAFAVTSDPQYNSGEPNGNVALLIGDINRLHAGSESWPGGGVVPRLKGVVVAGDLTQSASEGQFQAYEKQWTNSSSELKVDVYEGMGNHDFNKCSNPQRSVVFEGVVAHARKLKDEGKLTNWNFDHGHISWDWDGVHFVMLNEHAGGGVSAPRSGCAMNSRKFLENDVSKHGKGVPVVLFQHFGFDELSTRFGGNLLKRCKSDETWEWPKASKVSSGEIRYDVDFDTAPGRSSVRLQPVSTTLAAGDEKEAALDPSPFAGLTLPALGTTGRIKDGNGNCLTWNGHSGRECRVKKLERDVGWRACGSKPSCTQRWRVHKSGEGYKIQADSTSTMDFCMGVRPNWWSPDERRALAETLKSLRDRHATAFVALFHGHIHDAPPLTDGVSTWDWVSGKATPGVPSKPNRQLLTAHPGYAKHAAAYSGPAAPTRTLGYFVVRMHVDPSGSSWMRVYRRAATRERRDPPSVANWDWQLWNKGAPAGDQQTYYETAW